MPAMLSKAQSRPGGTPVGAGDARGRLAEGVPVPEPGCVSGGESGRRLSAAERRGPSLSSQAGQERTSPLEQRGWGGGTRKGDLGGGATEGVRRPGHGQR